MNMLAVDVKAPPAPMTLADTGLTNVLLLDIFLKTVYRRNLSTVSSMASAVCLSVSLTQELIEMARAQKLIQAMGNREASAASEMVYELSDAGKSRAHDALAQSEYYGPMPVPMADFGKQTERQSIRNVGITHEMLEKAMGHLVLPEGMLGELGPAVNSGRSILMYGPPGNGKSSISNGIRDALGDSIYVPYCIEYMGQVISVYDPIVHTKVNPGADDGTSLRSTGNRFDNRYIICNRPTVITGGELTLDMLNLKYNETSRTYQAPLQMKSTGGVFIVDDLGRQEETPQSLINRWIVPMESGYDILSLQSGEKFIVPFDTLVIFSTNFLPSEMFDGAAMRRIFFKLKIDGPDQAGFLKILSLVCKSKGMPLDEASLVHLLKNRYPEVDHVFANFHGPFLVDQMMAICEFEGVAPHMTPDLIDRAWANLFVDET